MPPDLFWHPEAEEDLIDIYATIASDHPGAAERICTAIETKIGLLADYPRMGPRRDDVARGVRILVERPYLVIYETMPDTDEGNVDSVLIVRIVDSRRRLDDLF